MDDESCVMKYIEIVPRDQSQDSSHVTDVKFEPVTVKVGTVVVFTPFTWFTCTMHIAHLC